MRAIVTAVLVSWVLGAVPPAAVAQTFDAWFDAQVEALLNRSAVGANGVGVDRQRDAPAGDRSASLVDQSSATDFVSVALNLAGVSDPRLSGSSAGAGPAGGEGSQTVTASFYALLAAANGKALMNPAFYKSHVNARRLSFTVGTTASDPEKHNTERPASVLGVKVLLINSRELFTAANQMKLSAVQSALRSATAEGATLKARIQVIVFTFLHPDGLTAGAPDPMAFATFLITEVASPGFSSLVQTLPEEAKEAIDAEIAAASAPFAALRAKINQAYDEIRGGRQLALAYFTRLRPEDGYDEHRAELIFDYGLSPRLTWTANGSFDYVDRGAAGSSPSGRFATELIGDLTRVPAAWGRLPVRLSGSAQFQWADSETKQKDVQVKLTVPLASGIDLPLTYRYTWSPVTEVGELERKGSQAKVTLALDPGRALANR